MDIVNCKTHACFFNYSLYYPPEADGFFFIHANQSTAAKQGLIILIFRAGGC